MKISVPGYQQNICHYLYSLQQANLYCNVAISTRDHCDVPAHSLVLIGSRSPVLQRMLQDATGKHLVIISGFDYESASVVQSMVKSLYTGEVEFSPETVEALKSLYSYLHLDEFVEVCDQAAEEIFSRVQMSRMMLKMKSANYTPFASNNSVQVCEGTAIFSSEEQTPGLSISTKISADDSLNISENTSDELAEDAIEEAPKYPFARNVNDFEVISKTEMEENPSVVSENIFEVNIIAGQKQMDNCKNGENTVYPQSGYDKRLPTPVYKVSNICARQMETADSSNLIEDTINHLLSKTGEKRSMSHLPVIKHINSIKENKNSCKSDGENILKRKIEQREKGNILKSEMKRQRKKSGKFKGVLEILRKREPCGLYGNDFTTEKSSKAKAGKRSRSAKISKSKKKDRKTDESMNDTDSTNAIFCPSVESTTNSGDATTDAMDSEGVFHIESDFQQCKNPNANSVPAIQSRGDYLCAHCDNLVRHCKCKRRGTTTTCCHLRFLDHAKLRAHKKAEHSVWCAQCDFHQVNGFVVAQHMYSKHKLMLDEEKYPVLTCDVEGCAFTYISKNVLYSHKIHKHSTPNYHCQYCERVFYTANLHRSHEKSHDPSERKHQCDTCGKKFHLKELLTDHVRSVHNAESRLMCHLCPWRSKSQNKKSLIYHLYTVHGTPIPEDVEIYRCDQCDYISLFSSKMREHNLHHTEEKSFQCQICGKLFHTSARLTSHAKSHQEYNIKCQYDNCGYQSKTQENMQSHIRSIHSTAKPFSCHLCPYSCKLRGNLLKHSRAKHKLTITTQSDLHKKMLKEGKGYEEYLKRMREHKSNTVTATLSVPLDNKDKSLYLGNVETEGEADETFEPPRLWDPDVEIPHSNVVVIPQEAEEAVELLCNQYKLDDTQDSTSL